MIILGISLGTRETGICVMDSGTLVDWQIHQYHAQWSEYKLQLILNQYKQYFQQYRINAVIIKVPPARFHSKKITQLLKHLDLLIQKYGIKQYDFITKAEIKQNLLFKNTEELIVTVVKKYPVLQPVFDKGVANGHEYYEKIYEAVISAYIFSNQIQFNSE